MNFNVVKVYQMRVWIASFIVKRPEDSNIAVEPRSHLGTHFILEDARDTPRPSYRGKPNLPRFIVKICLIHLPRYGTNLHFLFRRYFCGRLNGFVNNYLVIVSAKLKPANLVVVNRPYNIFVKFSSLAQSFEVRSGSEVTNSLTDALVNLRFDHWVLGRGVAPNANGIRAVVRNIYDFVIAERLPFGAYFLVFRNQSGLNGGQFRRKNSYRNAPTIVMLAGERYLERRIFPFFSLVWHNQTLSLGYATCMSVGKATASPRSFGFLQRSVRHR